MNEPSTFDQLKTGEWRRISLGILGALATVAVFLDVFTTSHILTSESYREFNRALATLSEVHVLLAIGLHATFLFSVVLVCWLSLGWLSTVAGWFVVIGIGIPGLNNLLGIWFAFWPLSYLPVELWMVTHFVLPAVAFLVGLLMAYRQHQNMPIFEVLIVGVLLFYITALLPILF